MNWSHKLIRKYFLGGDIECWNGECISLISLKLSFLPTYSSEMVSKWSKPLAVLSNFQSLWWNPRTAFQKFRNQMKPAWYWLHAALFVQRYYEDTRICCQHPRNCFFRNPIALLCFPLRLTVDAHLSNFSATRGQGSIVWPCCFWWIPMAPRSEAFLAVQQREDLWTLDHSPSQNGLRIRTWIIPKWLPKKDRNKWNPTKIVMNDQFATLCTWGVGSNPE